MVFKNGQASLIRVGAFTRDITVYKRLPSIHLNTGLHCI